MLNYALEVSGQDQLSYVGHSQGTSMGFGGFSSMPELAAKVKLFVPLAPVANVSHCEGLFKALSHIYKEGDVSNITQLHFVILFKFLIDSVWSVWN